MVISEFNSVISVAEWTDPSRKWWRERENRRGALVIPPTVDWSYCANRFELGSRSDPASRLEEPYSVIIGCLLIDHVMLIDSHRSMIKPLVAVDANLTIIDCESLIFTLPEVFSRRTLSLSFLISSW